MAAVFEAPAKEFDIVIRVSNYHYARGGFWSSVSLGNHEAIMKLANAEDGKEIFVIGGALLLAVFLFCNICYEKRA